MLGYLKKSNKLHADNGKHERMTGFQKISVYLRCFIANLRLTTKVEKIS